MKNLKRSNFSTCMKGIASTFDLGLGRADHVWVLIDSLEKRPRRTVRDDMQALKSDQRRISNDFKKSVARLTPHY